MIKKNILFLIPARKGSKGLKNKNLRMLGDKPLILYSTDFAKSVCNNNDIICVSTNDEKVIDLCLRNQISIPFLRPENISDDFSTSYDVIKHAIQFYEKNKIYFKFIMLLQPTSPFRLQNDFFEIEKKTKNKNFDMIVSVKKSKDSPYFNQFIEGDYNNLIPVIEGNKKYSRRQDSPDVFSYNGAFYLIRVKSFISNKDLNFKNILKLEMPNWRSIDIDNIDDLDLAKMYLNKFHENCKNNPKT